MKLLSVMNEVILFAIPTYIQLLCIFQFVFYTLDDFYK